MQHVNPKWLRNFCYSTLLFDVFLFGGYYFLQATNASQSRIDFWGITPFVLTLSAIHVFVTIFIYPIIKKRSEWAGFVTALVPYGIMLSAVIETSGNVNLIYRVLFIILVFMLNMVGPYLAIASAVIAWILLVFDFLNLGHPVPAVRAMNIIIDILVTIAAIGGWYFFRRFYIKQTDQETLAKLNNEKIKTNFILASMTDAVVLINPDKKIDYINPAASKMTGWPAQNAIGLPYTSVLKFYDQKQQPFTQSQEPLLKSLNSKKAVRENNIVLQNRAGTYIDVSVDAMPLLDDQSIETGGILGVLRDMTKERQEERQRTEFISTASHEMRTPVAAIEGYLSLALNDKVATIDERAKEYLNKAHASTQHLGQLFQDLLTSSKIDDGRLTDHPEVIEIGEYLEKLTEDLRFSAEKKNLIVEYIVGTDENVQDASSTNNKMIRPLYYVYSDPDRLREVITNLFDNAVKYTTTGKISIGLTGDKSVVQFYIKDTGAGIPSDDLPHLFQKFFRVDNSATRTIGGTGLGLFICKKILELYDGKIWATSRLGEGSTFFVNLPRLDSSRARAKQIQMQETAKNNRGTMLNTT
jgi:PAS domain S-box-containing protein